MSEHTLKLNPMEMKKYVDFLELKATELQTLCKQFDEQLIVATQCMDQLSGQTAAARLTRTMKQISQNIPRTAAAAHTGNHGFFMGMEAVSQSARSR